MKSKKTKKRTHAVAANSNSGSQLSWLNGIKLKFISCNAEYRFAQMHSRDSDPVELVRSAIKEHMTAAQGCVRVNRFYPENDKLLDVRMDKGIVVAKVAYTFPVFQQGKKNVLDQYGSDEIGKAIQDDLFDYACEAQWSARLRGALRLQSVHVTDTRRERRLTKELRAIKKKYLGSNSRNMTALEVLSVTNIRGK
jgi:hypothetical protein